MQALARSSPVNNLKVTDRDAFLDIVTAACSAVTTPGSRLASWCIQEAVGRSVVPGGVHLCSSGSFAAVLRHFWLLCRRLASLLATLLLFESWCG